MPSAKVREERAAARRLLDASPDKLIPVIHQSAAELTHLLGVPLPDGAKFKVMSEEEAEQADFVICQPIDLDTPLLFQDNIITRCGDCDRDIQHRPHAPRRPLKLCLICADRRVNG